MHTEFGSDISDTYTDIAEPWSADQVCAAAVLNSSSKGDKEPILSAVVEPGLPITLVARLVTQIDADLQTYVPKIVVPQAQGMYLFDELYRPTNSTLWTPDDIVSMLRFSILRNGGNWVSQGKINGAPFAFTGSDAQELFGQCYDYLDHTSPFTSNITSIFVNGLNAFFVPKATVEKACTAIVDEAGTWE